MTGIPPETILPEPDIELIWQTAQSCGLAGPERRPLLLDGIPVALVNDIPRYARPGDQIRHDLRFLNRQAPRGASRLPPLARWLDNASGMTNGSASGQVFLLYWKKVATPVLDPLTEAPSDALHSPPLASGQMFDGRFVLSECISAGPDDQIWTAGDPNTQRTVALRVFTGAAPDARDRFIRGARHMAGLECRGVAEVREVEADPKADKRSYYCMKCLPGGTLETGIREGLLDLDAALEAVLQVGDAIATAHRRGIIHRAVRPGIILLDSLGEARITDFDSMHLRDDPPTPLPRALQLSPWCAPELRAGAHQAEPRADVFGLARCAAMALMAGLPPAMRDARIEEWSNRTGEHDLLGLPGASDVIAVIRQAMSPQPRHRPESVEVLLGQLRTAREHGRTSIEHRFVPVGRPAADVWCRSYVARPDPRDRRLPSRVRVRVYSDEGSRRLETLFPGEHWFDVRLHLHHEAIAPILMRGRDSRDRCWSVSGLPPTDRRCTTRLLEVIVDCWHQAPGDQTWDRMAHAMADLCSVVAFAHRQGVVHRALNALDVGLTRDGTPYIENWDRAAPTTALQQAGMQDARAVIAMVLGALVPQAGWLTAADVEVDFAAMRSAVVELRRRETARSITALIGIAEQVLDDATFGHGAPIAHLGQMLTEWVGIVRAERRFAAAQALHSTFRRRQNQARALQAAAHHARRAVFRWDGEARKGRWWANADRAREVLEDSHRLRARWLDELSAIRHVVPAAQTALVTFYRAAWTDAVRHDDREGAAWAMAALRLVDPVAAQDCASKRYAVAFDGPAGAEVCISRYVSRRHRLVPEPVRQGPLPTDRIVLPPGSYRAEYRSAGHPISVPFLVGPHPDDAVVTLPDLTGAALAADDVVIAGGPFIAGGDPHAIDALDRTMVWIDPFVMKRHPVTHRQFVAFLNDIWLRGHPDRARSWAPRRLDLSTGPSLLYRETMTGLAFDPGDRLHIDAPVAFITWSAAAEFARWHADRTRQPWRLPHELEWEKAARGVDGRFFPWGDRLDESFANVAESQRDRPRAIPVDRYAARFPVDLSPYGVCGLGGNTRDWCSTPWRAGGPRLPLVAGKRIINLDDVVRGRPRELAGVRGGAWSNGAPSARSSLRLTHPPARVSPAIGLRLVRSLETSHATVPHKGLAR